VNDMARLKTTGIDHVNLEVRDLDETTDFYAALLGFEVMEDMPEHNGRIIGNEWAKLAIYESEDFRRQGNESGFAHVSFHIENFDEITAVCDSLNIPVKYGGAVQWPRSHSIYIDDPNGYEIELAEVWGGGL
jgi:lactoylglutathione lyase